MGIGYFQILFNNHPPPPNPWIKNICWDLKSNRSLSLHTEQQHAAVLQEIKSNQKGILPPFRQPLGGLYRENICGLTLFPIFKLDYEQILK